MRPIPGEMQAGDSSKPAIALSTFYIRRYRLPRFNEKWHPGSRARRGSLNLTEWLAQQDETFEREQRSWEETAKRYPSGPQRPSRFDNVLPDWPSL